MISSYRTSKGNYVRTRDISVRLCSRVSFLTVDRLSLKVKNSVRNSLISIADKIQPRKRTLIETANDELKDIAQIEHFSDIVF